MASGHVISDLHLFAQRSVADSYMHHIRRAATKSEFFVLNGDIFDFRWSTLPTVDDSLDAAVAWLRALVTDHPHCQFFYTLGNHDCYEPFIERLDVLATDTPNLQWHPSHLRLGTVLFLHGDLPLARRGADRVTRTFHPALGRNGRTLRMLYRLFVAFRGHRLLASLHQPRSCAKQIAQWLKADANGFAEGVTDVYFGHTHHAFADFEYGGLRFHNTGSTIRGLSSRMLEVRTINVPGTPAMTDAERAKVDCYADGDRDLMVWSQKIRASMLRPLLKLLARLGVTADVVTLVSLVLGLAFCPVYFFSKPLALALLALHMCADGLDGPMARFTGTASRKGSFTDTMSDQIVVAATTVTLILDGVLGVLPGGLYIFSYTVVIAFAMIRNALSIPYSWLVRPRFIIYAWLPIELYLLPGSLDYVIWLFVALLVGKMASGYVRIRRRL